MRQISLRGIGLLGIVIFAPLFLFTFLDPNLIESSGKTFIEWKLQSETTSKIDSIQLPAPTRLEKLLGNKAKEKRNKVEEELASLKRQLEADAPAIIAAQIAKLRNLDCECRKHWEQKLKGSIQMSIVSLEIAREKLIEFSHVKYMQIVAKLTMDVRIFLGANAFIFIFLFMASFLKPLAVKQLFLPGGLMFVSTVICSYFYLFEQNWFYTIIYNDYTGYSFIGYLFIVFAILCDIVFNKARITTEILNVCLQALGQAGNLVPC
jgi:hypothetical protein